MAGHPLETEIGREIDGGRGHQGIGEIEDVIVERVIGEGRGHDRQETTGSDDTSGRGHETGDVIGRETAGVTEEDVIGGGIEIRNGGGQGQNLHHLKRFDLAS